MNYKELMNMESFVGIKDRFLSLVPAQLFELVRSKQAVIISDIAKQSLWEGL